MTKTSLRGAKLEIVVKASFLASMSIWAVLAFSFRSASATGRESLLHFTSYGYWEAFGTGLLILVLTAQAAVGFITIDIPYWERQVLYAYQGEAHPNLTSRQSPKRRQDRVRIPISCQPPVDV